MFKHELKLRVRYSETDQMGFVYYGNYATYFEVARVESLRKLGVRYKELEENGIWLPVSHYEVKYLKPATYDEELKIETLIERVPSARINFKYKCCNELNEIIAEASTELFFMKASSKRPMRCPESLTKALSPYFDR